MPPMPPKPFKAPSTSLAKLYLTEGSGFVSGRLGEAVFKNAPPELISKAAGMIPDGVLDTPDRQKNFAFAIGLFVLTLSRSAAAASAVEKFLIESFEEISLRKEDLKGSDERRKAIMHEAFNKRASQLDALRASPAATPVVGMNYPTALALLSAGKQVEHFDWLARQMNETRALARDHGYGIATTPEHILSIMHAPESIRLELFKDMLLKSPKLSPGKSRLDSVLDKIGQLGNEWIDPSGEKMTSFVKEQDEKTKATEARTKRLSRLF